MNPHFFLAQLLILVYLPITWGHVLNIPYYSSLNTTAVSRNASVGSPSYSLIETEIIRMKRQCGAYGCGGGAGVGCRSTGCGAGGCRGPGCSGCGRLCANSCSNPCGYGNRLCCDNPAPRPCVACGLASGRTIPMPTPLTAAAIHRAPHCCTCCMPACLPSCVNFGGCACNRFGYDYWDYFG